MQTEGLGTLLTVSKLERSRDVAITVKEVVVVIVTMMQEWPEPSKKSLFGQ